MWYSFSGQGFTWSFKKLALGVRIDCQLVFSVYPLRFSLPSLLSDLLRIFFDALYDEDVIKEEAFYKWESSKDPAEQQGKGVALKSVTAFYTWLREADDESDNN